MRGLLGHAAKRSMALALVARPDTKSREFGEIVEQAGVAFDVVRPAAEGADAADLDGALAALTLEPHRVLAVCADLSFVAEAKKLRLRTCLLLEENEELPVRHDRRPDHGVRACADVVDVIDDLNGLSFRR